ncbi:uncharacterized protein LY89DRAFT_736549 [Mollisia scopiformis]|uniref:Zn(2)-C6 fungal-type domain-containing protein n=1 Tax=Mollisia scopiformis TaxID=149040 RepID=A0A194X2W0_MOLSC|nr:uncharacterized protein LY89DRAFT_736549 [Mollisia scopiformis]KUJ14516.1 hypothetical protein LY89DRAFT_736549 [Mollisia scopiformis]
MGSSDEAQPLLKCNTCGKNFDNRKSHLRHKSYCKKAITRVTTRKKSCTACTKARTRCARDTTLPKCSRCTAKDLTCDYEQDPHGGLVALIPVELSASSHSPSDSNVRPLIDEQPGLPTDLLRIETMSTSEFENIIPRVPTAFSAREIEHNQLSLNRRYVLCTLKSYPYMLLPGRNLPPFIHPYHAYGLKDSDNNSQVRKYTQPPIQNCAMIIRWHSADDKNNTVYIWKTISLELEKFSKECPENSDENAVAALQAITIYFLLRISEDMDEAAVYDMLLIHTMVKVATKVKDRIKSNNIRADRWEHWMLTESIQRTITVILLLDMLFEISPFFPARECDGTLLADIALPCSKGLWTASTEVEWEIAHSAEDKQTSKTLTYADLMNFQHQEEGSLDFWLSYIDNFGTLLMAAASLQPPNNFL